MGHTRHLIAVIDDEMDIVDLYRDIFSDSYEVLGFTSPLDFLKALENNHLEELVLVISDYKMPKMTGLEMLQQLRQQGRDVALLLLSGYVDKSVALDALNLGINKVLEKPVNIDLLVETAEALIKEYRLSRLEHQMVKLNDQLSELYIIYRDLLMPEVRANPQGIVTVDSVAHEVQTETPLSLISRLEKRILSLQKEKNLIKQDAI